MTRLRNSFCLYLYSLCHPSQYYISFIKIGSAVQRLRWNIQLILRRSRVINTISFIQASYKASFYILVIIFIPVVYFNRQDRLTAALRFISFVSFIKDFHNFRLTHLYEINFHIKFLSV